MVAEGGDLAFDRGDAGFMRATESGLLGALPCFAVGEAGAKTAAGERHEQIFATERSCRWVLSNNEVLLQLHRSVLFQGAHGQLSNQEACPFCRKLSPKILSDSQAG